MSVLSASPILDASGSVRGAVSTGTQTFAGDKTFTGAVSVSGTLTVGGTTIITSMATNSLLGRSTAGTGAPEVISVGSGLTLSGGVLTASGGGGGATISSALGGTSGDVVTRAGSTVADASVNAAAKLFSVRTGIGGTEVEKLYVDATGAIRGNGALLRGSSTSSGFVSVDDAAGSRLSYGSSEVRVASTGTTVYGTLFSSVTGAAYNTFPATASNAISLTTGQRLGFGTNWYIQESTDILDIARGGSLYLRFNPGVETYINAPVLKISGIYRWSNNAAGGLYDLDGVSTRLDASSNHILNLTSPLGTGSTDICIKAGTTSADTFVNASAKLFSIRTGIGGTEVEKVYVDKAGNMVLTGNVTANGTLLGAGGGGGATISSALGAGSTDIVTRAGTTIADASLNSTAKLLSIRSGIGATETEYAYFYKGGLNVSGQLSVQGGINAYNGGITVGFAGFGVGASTEPLTYSAGWGLASTQPAHVFNGTTVQTNAVDVVAIFQNGVYTPLTGNAAARIMAFGRIDQYGTDSSGTPGAATINKGTGISAIASGASTVVITNSMATTGSRVLITWLGDHGAARSWVTRAAGSFTVNLSANASAATSFAWEVSSLL